MLNIEYTYEDWIIDYSDVLIQFTTFDKKINQSYIDFFGKTIIDIKAIHDVQCKFNLFSPKTIDGNFDSFNNFCTKVYEDIKNHLVYNDYITIQPNTWTLTERGLLLKELGGHKKFIKHRRRELSVFRNQNLINLVLGFTAVASIFMPIIIEIYKSDKPNEIKFNNKTDSLLNRQTTIIDSLQKDIRSIKDSHFFLHRQKTQFQEKK